MDWKQLAKENEGFHTVESFSKDMGICRATAINYLHAMRKRRLLETERGHKGKRLYKISPVRLRKVGYPGLIETINEHSSLKLEPFVVERSDHNISIEEAISRAPATRDFRIIMASLDLFRKTEDWWSLYRHAKESHTERYVGALYFLSRRLFRVRSMDKRVLGLLKRAKASKRYIIPRMRGSDFEDIEKEWGVYLPFNRADLERFKK